MVMRRAQTRFHSVFGADVEGQIGFQIHVGNARFPAVFVLVLVEFHIVSVIADNDRSVHKQAAANVDIPAQRSRRVAPAVEKSVGRFNAVFAVVERQEQSVSAVNLKVKFGVHIVESGHKRENITCIAEQINQTFACRNQETCTFAQHWSAGCQR